MDFGVDPSSAILRHCLEDSDEEEEDISDSDNERTFLTPDQDGEPSPGANLILAIGQPASIFVRSFLSLDPLPSCRITVPSPTVFKDRYFPTGRQPDGHKHTVSEGFRVKNADSTSERFLLCIHEQQLNSQYCNLWYTKVRHVIGRLLWYCIEIILLMPNSWFTGGPATIKKIFPINESYT